MKKNLFAGFFAILLAACNSPEVENDYARYVDVFTGTGVHGHTFPGSVRPFGMVQLSPDTHLMGWDASSGYHWADSVIYAFSHTHLSGTGIGDLGDVALLPYSGAANGRPVGRFSHADESAEPGYYRVRLSNFGVEAELTSTERVGVHRYSWPADSTRGVMLDLQHILQSDWGHKLVGSSWERSADDEFVGTIRTKGWAENHTVHFVIRFSEAPAVVEERDGRVFFEFAQSGEPLLAKVAISPVDVAGARANMEAEMMDWDFDKVRNDSRDIWNRELSKIDAQSSDAQVLENFYTALYHTMTAPILWQDADGRYVGMDRRTRTAQAGKTNYTAFSLWDTFRAWWPLMTIMDPERAAGMGGVLVEGWREGGILPKWPLASNYTGCMVAYPAVSVLADLQAKGLARDSKEDLLRSAVASSIYREDLATRFAGTREADLITKHVYYKDKYGFVPADSIAESVSWGLEMAYDDWCVAQLAKVAGDSTVYGEYMKKSALWRRYLDPETRLMRGVMGDGGFRTPFNPYYSAHASSDYTEGTAFQWSFFVPHDMPAWIDALGGPERLEAALDELFTLPSTVDGDSASADISGLVGQYAHGNEPSHHIAYLYNWTAAPWKGQKLLDQVMRQFYSPTPEGVIGNEDMGQMSAWYVMSAMGIYQVCPGEAVYALGRPMLDRAVIGVEGGRFEIVAHDNSPQNMFVTEVRLNGKTLDTPFIRHEDIAKGGKLEFFMGVR